MWPLGATYGSIYTLTLIKLATLMSSLRDFLLLWSSTIRVSCCEMFLRSYLICSLRNFPRKSSFRTVLLSFIPLFAQCIYLRNSRECLKYWISYSHNAVIYDAVYSNGACVTTNFTRQKQIHLKGKMLFIEADSSVMQVSSVAYIYMHIMIIYFKLEV